MEVGAAVMQLKGPIRALLIILGTLCVVLGLLGMLLPLLPTTPFLLLAAICYARSSERFYRWLIANRWCGAYIRNFREGRHIPVKQRALTILLLWLTVGSTAWLAIPHWWLVLILLGVAIGVTTYLLRLWPFRPKPQPRPSLTEFE